ncbi:protein MIZU-KUSSEI 1-like [Amaranthus tricolor]|uniref:protein MIZU-KUSSEI 1-like n=1 Tax=Amaranthus tricolor TaxID=29722 RepID=UPI002589CD92|nr:protein MIZU-KUSSEI 1-like [Amaranthus tricolor]
MGATSTEEILDKPQPPKLSISLIEPPKKHKKHRSKPFRTFQNIWRSIPIISPICKFPNDVLPDTTNGSTHTGIRVTGTLFGYRKGRVSLALQENPGFLPSLVVELDMQFNALKKEMSIGTVRIAFECEKRVEKDKRKLLEEPIWSVFCNGNKIGYGVKREANDEDLNVMELLKNMSMGAGVLPGISCIEGVDGEMAYMRGHFQHFVGSKDSETLYMLCPYGNTNATRNGPELSIFFVRI